MTTYLPLAAMLAFVLFPLLIPTWAPARTAGYQRRNSPRRLAVAAA